MSTWYRRNACLRKGHKEYTNCGYEQAKKIFITDDLDVDCSDKHYLITGSNRGIGLETAVEIARRGGVVHFLCRNRASMLEARSHLITTTGNDKLHLHTLDLSRPRDVGRWAQDFVSTHDQLDVLINNAGTMNVDRTVDEDGIETTFAVNTLSIHLLTIILLPLLQRSPEPRVVTVSSADLLKVKLDSDDFHFGKMEPFDGYQAYAQTKRQQVVMNACYAHRYDSVKFYSMHPGWVDTKLLKRSQPEFYSLMQDSLRTPNQGADTVVWLAITKAALKYASGLFFQDRIPVSYHLPLAWTRQTPLDEKKFMQKLDQQFALVSSYSYNFEASSESGLDESNSNWNNENEVKQSWKSSSSTASQSSYSEMDSDLNFTNNLNDSIVINPNTVEQIENSHYTTDEQLTVNSGFQHAINSLYIKDPVEFRESHNVYNSTIDNYLHSNNEVHQDNIPNSIISHTSLVENCDK